MPMFSDNICLLSDSYKVSHHKQYPPKTTKVYSYFESRGGLHEDVVFFGLQYILKRYLSGPVVTEEAITEASNLYKDHFGSEVFNEDGWRYILEKHGGCLPVRIRAVPEGSVIPYKNVLFTVENTDPNCFWLTNYLETIFVQIWYPCTVATNSREQKKIIAEAMNESSDSLEGLPFKLHDFGFRGVSSVESAAIGGLAHLVNFTGTDTVAAFVMGRQFYSCPMAGFSIPAAEHSTITTWGRKGEVDAFRNMLQSFPKGLVAVVSDSYDIFHAISNLWGDHLKSMIEARDGCLVVRPDSGDPATIVVKVLELLGVAFGTSENSKGYKLLPPCVRVIQGDGINIKSLSEILSNMHKHGWSADNVGFGSGGSLLQRLHRDTQKFAYKCSFAIIDDEEVNVYKDPITDPGKKSKKGRLSLHLNSDTGEYTTCQEGTGELSTDLLRLVFENGRIIKEYSMDDIRQRAEIELVRSSKTSS